MFSPQVSFWSSLHGGVGDVFLWKGMSCHSFLRAVRYGNIIIGVYTGGSGSTELFCVRPDGNAGAGLDEKHQHPVPLSGMACWAGCLGGQTAGNAKVTGVESIWSKIFIVQSQ